MPTRAISSASFSTTRASASYSEVVFSPTGVAKVNLVENGVVNTLATANYGGTPQCPVRSRVENSASFVSVLVNGARLFENVPAAEPEQFPEGGVGLITHWAPGRFDNIQFEHGFRSVHVAFDEPLSQSWIVSGAWNTNGGTLNSTAVGQSDIVKLDSPCRGNDRGDEAAPTRFTARGCSMNSARRATWSG